MVSKLNAKSFEHRESNGKQNPPSNPQNYYTEALCTTHIVIRTSVGLHVLRSGPDILPKPLGFRIKSWDCILQPCHDMQKTLQLFQLRKTNNTG